jgi:cytidylate kinase
VGDQIWLDNEEVSQAIRDEAIGNAASKIAVYPSVRQALLDLQRHFAKEPGLVADGRDMGTVVFPEAQLKIYLTASVAARAQRRFKQLKEKGISANIDSLSNDLVERDARDQNRMASPLKPAQDAYVLDSSNMTIDEVAHEVLQQYQGGSGRAMRV